MKYQGLESFVRELEHNEYLHRVKSFVDPVLEITEITDRIIKAGDNKAILFENTGTKFPLLINAFGSEERLMLALGISNPDDAGREIDNLLNALSSPKQSFMKKLATLPLLSKLSGIMPSWSERKGSCQDVILKDPDLGILPVLKCWPHDGGRFITLPLVHTFHPDTNQMNVGMYRMQIIDKNTTAMHWQRHKTGANHFAAWKKKGMMMPVSVALGGDPVFTYSATAPLPENINEYILAGFLRKKRVKLVKCITNDIYVPSDADIIIEGYVDPSEEFIFEGPFGDHTGFYSLADWYPKFHVTCITHSKNAIYPATIVGIPPQEDAWLAYATEKIFLSPVKLSLAPEVIDFHMPTAGTAHNLLIVKIEKSYPGQGVKVLNSLSGAGQLMFAKFIIVVSGSVNIRNYNELGRHIFRNIDFRADIIFNKGPLDVLDHASDNFSFGGKAGLDATVKLEEEGPARNELSGNYSDVGQEMVNSRIITSYNNLADDGLPVLIISINPSADPDAVKTVKQYLGSKILSPCLILAVDHTVDVNDLFTVTWQVLSNTDPLRDHEFTGSSLFIDGTIKIYGRSGFKRDWPNVVCSDKATIEKIDEIWTRLFPGSFIESPSNRFRGLVRPGKDKIKTEI